MVAVDRAGTLYVADRGNNRVLQLRRSDSGATQLPVSGLSGPAGVALGADGAVYVSNIGNNLLLKFDPGVVRCNSPPPVNIFYTLLKTPPQKTL